MSLGRFDTKTLAKVVAFSLVAVALTVALGFKIANTNLFADEYELEAEFDNATGVFKGDAVKLAGVDIGRVREAWIENGKAIVRFTVDDSVRLTTDSRIGLRWRNVIGLRFLYVYPGDASGQRVQEGYRFPSTQTDSAGDIGAFLNRLGPILQAIDPEKANAFIEAMNTALAGNELAVRTLLSDGAVLSGELGDMDAEIESLITNSDTILAAYAGQSRSLGDVLENLDHLGGDLRGMTQEINALITNFAVVQQEFEQLLRENRDNIDGSISGLNNLARILDDNRHTLEQTLCSLPAGVVPYDETSSWGEWFNVRIVEITFKDNQGNDIVRQGEGPGARPTNYPGVFTCRDEKGLPTPVLRGQQSDQQAGTQARTLGSWMDSVTGGGSVA